MGRVVSEWQPVASAPKDERQDERLIGYAPDARQFGFDSTIQIMRYSGWGGGTGGFEVLAECFGDATWMDFPATHWMPLPEPPK